MSVRIALAQVNPTVGDVWGNAAIVERAIEEASRLGADVVALPELMITGYPPEDLVLRKSFVEQNRRALEQVASTALDLAAIVGFVESDGDSLYNAAALCVGGQVHGIYRKQRLPNYGVFDERRYFTPGEGILLGKVGENLIGINICEDLWIEDGPHAECAAAGASLIININGSPYHRNKGQERLELLSSRARRFGVVFAYVNMFGGQDELVFDGQSLVVDAGGNLVARAKQFEEQMLVFDFEPGPPSMMARRRGAEQAVRIINISNEVRDSALVATAVEPEQSPVEEVFSALVLGMRDYWQKNGFTETVIGLSGGIDSSVAAVVASHALGAPAVTGVLMPSEYTSEQSNDYAHELAANLGISTETLHIEDPYEALLKALDPVFAGTEQGIAEENLQSRIRGLLLMAISNKRPGCIVTSTGNKSEMATGYSTLYGDMAGGFSILKDVPKTLVYELAEWINRESQVIPRAVIERAPSAELRPDQKDTDSLPPYEVLDPILEAYVEDDKSVDEIAAVGFDRAIVSKVARMVDAAEYKRRQSPPGVKVTDRAFGRDRRLPITNRFRWPEP